MIIIECSGTCDIEHITPENRSEFIGDCLRHILDNLDKSKFKDLGLSYTESRHLPEGKLFFKVSFEALPTQEDVNAVPRKSKDMEIMPSPTKESLEARDAKRDLTAVTDKENLNALFEAITYKDIIRKLSSKERQSIAYHFGSNYRGKVTELIEKLQEADFMDDSDRLAVKSSVEIAQIVAKEEIRDRYFNSKK